MDKSNKRRFCSGMSLAEISVIWKSVIDDAPAYVGEIHEGIHEDFYLTAWTQSSGKDGPYLV